MQPRRRVPHLVPWCWTVAVVCAAAAWWVAPRTGGSAGGTRGVALGLVAVTVAGATTAGCGLFRRGRWEALIQAVLTLSGLIFLFDLVSDIPQRVAPVLVRNPAVGMLILASVTSALGAAAPSRRFRSILGVATVVVVSTCLAVAVGELCFRHLVMVPKVPRTWGQFRRVVSAHWPKPVSRQPTTGVYRILGLADSFGQADGPRNYHFVLAESLNAVDPIFEMVNFSVGEYEPADELALLTRFGPAYSPHLVLHGFCVGNDFAYFPQPLLTLRDISVRASTGFPSLLPHNFTSREWVRRASIFWRERAKLARERKATPRRRPAARRPRKPPGPAPRPPHVSPPRPTPPPEASQGTFPRATFLRIVRNRMNHAWNNLPRHQFFTVVGILDAIRTESAQMGARYVMVILPDQYQVEEELFRSVCEEFGLDPAQYDVDRPQRLLVNYCRLHGIPYVDLLPALRAAGSDGGLFRPRDTHYNVRGNQVAGAEIARALLALGIREWARASGTALAPRWPARQVRIGRSPYGYEFVTHDTPPTMRASGEAVVFAGVRNVSDRTWPRKGSIKLGYYWTDESGRRLRDLEGRGLISRDTPPGAVSDCRVNVRAPEAPGTYRLVWDMVEEQVAWFGTRGATPLVVTVRVD